MEAIGIIPARLGSTRFEGKVLADVLGKPMIQWVYEAASRARSLDELIVAADDEQIEAAVKSFGGKVVLTAKGHSSGTDRLTEIANPLEVKVVVNIQADEPLIQPSMIDALVNILLKDPTINMATMMRRIEDKNELHDPNVVKVVADSNGFALYFSRTQIPYLHQRFEGYHRKFYKHIGLYAYTKDFLFAFTNLPISGLEKAEGLEQLRALEHGYKIKVIETQYDTIGVDTPSDLEKVREKLKSLPET